MISGALHGGGGAVHTAEVTAFLSTGEAHLAVTLTCSEHQCTILHPKQMPFVPVTINVTSLDFKIYRSVFPSNPSLCSPLPGSTTASCITLVLNLSVSLPVNQQET